MGNAEDAAKEERGGRVETGEISGEVHAPERRLLLPCPRGEGAMPWKKGKIASSSRTSKSAGRRGRGVVLYRQAGTLLGVLLLLGAANLLVESS